MAHLAIEDYLAFDEYQAQEREVDVGREYVGGHVYAIAGGSDEHNTIATSVTGVGGIGVAVIQVYRRLRKEVGLG